jgi:predicted acylesterase/phospholipase RssA
VTTAACNRRPRSPDAPNPQVAQHLRASPPFQLLKPSLQPWRGGLLSLDAVVERLAQLLPPTFEELDRDFAVGVVTAEGEHVLIDSGPLPEAVAASAAIPFVFSSVDVPGGARWDASVALRRCTWPLGGAMAGA